MILRSRLGRRLQGIKERSDSGINRACVSIAALVIPVDNLEIQSTLRLIARVLIPLVYVVIGMYLTLRNGKQPVVIVGRQDWLTLCEPVFFTPRDGQLIAL